MKSTTVARPKNNSSKSNPAKSAGSPPNKTLGPVSDLEKHLPPEWWKTLFNSLYLKTDGDVVENPANTNRDIDLLIETIGLKPENSIVDLCCGQGRHSIELSRRGFRYVTGIDRSRYLVRLARKRAKQLSLKVTFQEGDARKIKLPDASQDCVCLMGNSFGYFESQEDDMAVLDEIKRVLRPEKRLILDVVDGSWMKEHFEPRSWEWIDQNHFVCRERTLASDRCRIVTREVIVNAELGVIADQFYAERLYTLDELQALLHKLDFVDFVSHGVVDSYSSRGQDLGMMANRLFVSAATKHKKKSIVKPRTTISNFTVIMGDPRLPDTVKKNGVYNPEDFETIDKLKGGLKKVKDFTFKYLDNHETLINQLMDNPPDCVFNLCDEGFYNQANLELHVPALLEMLGIPYTGSGPVALATCYNKALVRALAATLDIPVPLETYFDPSDNTATLPSTLPALLKPNTGDSSLGITKEAVVHNADELISYLEGLREKLPGIPILIQEFLSGTEYTVGLIGNPDSFEALPILEVDYSDLPPELPRILSYESKWLPDSPYWSTIKYKEANLSEENQRALVDYSMRLFERLGCQDYARIDFRADSQGVIKLLEVNPNPGWCWDGKMNLMASMKGWTYSQMLEAILLAAKSRLGL